MIITAQILLIGVLLLGASILIGTAVALEEIKPLFAVFVMYVFALCLMSM